MKPSSPPPTSLRRRRHQCSRLVPLFLLFSFFFIFSFYTSYPAATFGRRAEDPCAGRYIYVHDVPSRFNSDLLRDCATLSQWVDMCPYTSNSGLGRQVEGRAGVLPRRCCWHDTHQFSLDPIFHERMKRYPCLTADSALASALFVPFYAGFDVGRFLWGSNVSARDAAAEDLARWLRARPEWGRMGGRDHFLLGGRVTWDFQRAAAADGGGSGWGNRLLFLPEMMNMTVLVVESGPWVPGFRRNDVSIPYPTYFHPARASDVSEWQDRARKAARPWLFAFAGAPRPSQAWSIRGEIIEQCRESTRCKLLDCERERATECYSPESVMAHFGSSAFCLQPIGDSFTRRSTFDAMLAGCVPVFFHPGSAYVQYPWHLPRNYSSWSVFIPEDEVKKGVTRVEDVLGRIREEEVERMREAVIGMIPKFVYADPRVPPEEGLRDAFDVAVDGVLERVARRKKAMRRINGGFISSPPPSDEEDYMLHEWDRYFLKMY